MLRANRVEEIEKVKWVKRGGSKKFKNPFLNLKQLIWLFKIGKSQPLIGNGQNQGLLSLGW